MQKPFASRTNVYRSQREYPSFSRRVHTPAYSSLSDPHLEHYFRRKMEAERLALSSASTAGATRTFSPLRLQPRAFLSSSRGSSRASQLSSTKRRPLQKNNGNLQLRINYLMLFILFLFFLSIRCESSITVYVVACIYYVEHLPGRVLTEYILPCVVSHSTSVHVVYCAYYIHSTALHSV